MAHGKPIIANAVGGVPDLVSEDVGVLVAPDDVQGLAASMVRMAGDVDLRRRMSLAARLKYEQLFTPEAVLPVLLDFYEEIVDRHRCNDASDGGQRPRTEPLHPWII